MAGLHAVEQAVTRLDSAGQCPPDRLAVSAGPVPAHNLDAGVPAQTRLQHLSLTARQDIDLFPGLGVDQHDRVRVTAARGEVVDGSTRGTLTSGSGIRSSTRSAVCRESGTPRLASGPAQRGPLTVGRPLTRRRRRGRRPQARPAG